ncbi:DUF111 family protein [Oceanobacillus sp. 143]|nr:DUF111 family protein [Oceanobacillus sp. 143]
MTIGALLDAGGDFEHLEEELKKLQIDDEYELKISKVVKNGITSTKFDVVLGNEMIQDHTHTHDHGDYVHAGNTVITRPMYIRTIMNIVIHIHMIMTIHIITDIITVHTVILFS